MTAPSVVLLSRVALVTAGAVITAGGVASDWPGRTQIVIGVVGLGMIVAGFAVRLEGAASRLATHSRLLAFIFISLPLLGIGLAAAELYARHIQGSRLWSLRVQQGNFFELDRLKIYNRRFYEGRRQYFRGWPIPLELFDASGPMPRYLFKPNLRMASRGRKLVPAGPGDEVYWSSNSWGFRSPEFLAKKPPGVIRIVCLGASTTEGSQGDRETYPYFLQHELSRRYPNKAIEVINAGHHAYGIDDFLALVRQRVFPLRPDIVIFYEAANNINRFEFLATHRRHTPSSLSYGVAVMRAHSALFEFLSDSLGWTQYVPHDFDESSPKASALHYKDMLRQIVRETLQHGSLIVLSSFITVAHERLRVSPRGQPLLVKNLQRDWNPFTPGEIGRIFAYFNRRSKQVALEFQVPYADVAIQFPKDLRYFPFDILHLSPEGNRLLASLFADSLAKEVLPRLGSNRP